MADAQKSIIFAVNSVLRMAHKLFLGKDDFAPSHLVSVIRQILDFVRLLGKFHWQISGERKRAVETGSVSYKFKIFVCVILWKLKLKKPSKKPSRVKFRWKCNCSVIFCSCLDYLTFPHLEPHGINGARINAMFAVYFLVLSFWEVRLSIHQYHTIKSEIFWSITTWHF